MGVFFLSLLSNTDDEGRLQYQTQVGAYQARQLPQPQLKSHHKNSLTLTLPLPPLDTGGHCSPTIAAEPAYCAMAPLLPTTKMESP